MAVMKRVWAGEPDITTGRIVDAEVKDSRHLVYYLPDQPVVAVFDGDAVLDGRSIVVDHEAGTCTPRMRPAIGLRFLVR